MIARWYMVNRIGMATLCGDESGALEEAETAQAMWPHMGPHRAVQLAEVACFDPVYRYISDVVNSDASEDEKDIARAVMRLLPMQIALAALNASPQDALWCIFVPGPDEYHAAPSEQAARLMADKHNSAMTAYFKSNPPTDSSPSPESCAAHVTKWPFEPEDHQAAMAEFDYAAWGIEPPTRQ